MFTYHLKDGLNTKKEIRQEAEKERTGEDLPSAFPGWEEVEAERREAEPKIWLTVKDHAGNVVRRLEGPRTGGFHRINWDLRFPPPNAVALVEGPPPLFGGPPQGLMAAPGSYSVTLSKQDTSGVTQLAGPQSFEVVQLRSGALPGASLQDVAAFWRAYESALRTFSAMHQALAGSLVKVERMGAVIANSTADTGDLDVRLASLRAELQDLDQRLNGNRSKQQPGEKSNPVIVDRLGAVGLGVGRSSYGPTATHRRMLAIATTEIDTLYSGIRTGGEKMAELVQDLLASGAPWLEGEDLPAMIER